MAAQPHDQLPGATKLTTFTADMIVENAILDVIDGLAKFSDDQAQGLGQMMEEPGDQIDRPGCPEAIGD